MWRDDVADSYVTLAETVQMERFAYIMCWQEKFEGVSGLPYAAEWDLDA